MGFGGGTSASFPTVSSAWFVSLSKSQEKIVYFYLWLGFNKQFGSIYFEAMHFKCFDLSDFYTIQRVYFYSLVFEIV